MPQEQKTETYKSNESDDVTDNQISVSITRFLHKARDIKRSARIFVPAAYEMTQARFKKAKEELEVGEALLESKEEGEHAHGMKKIQEAVRKFERIRYSEPHKIVETSLFLSLFTAFDEYTGELLAAFYERKPELFSTLNRQINLVDVLTASSIEELKRSVLNDVIENFRRKSYVEQFSELETRHGLVLRKFARWPDFVECTQRRNLMTHCGGVVSEQYRKICKEEKYPENKIPELGTVLESGPQYFLPTCELMIEVGLKLGQTLWRKILPEEMNEADSHLIHTQYDALYSQNWERAKVFGEFAVSQKNYSDEISRRMCIINYCIALKFSGREKESLDELNKVDWSASVDYLRLAEAVLKDRFQDAASIMVSVGKNCKMLREQSYHIWPLFTKFRESPEFMRAYEQIYGYPFLTELKRYADEALNSASAQEQLSETKLTGETTADSSGCA